MQGEKSEEDGAPLVGLEEASTQLIASESKAATNRQKRSAIPVKEDYFLPEDEQGSDAGSLEDDQHSDVISENDEADSQQEDESDLESSSELDSDVEDEVSEASEDGSDKELEAQASEDEHEAPSRKRKVILSRVQKGRSLGKNSLLANLIQRASTCFPSKGDSSTISIF